MVRFGPQKKGEGEKSSPFATNFQGRSVGGQKWGCKKKRNDHLHPQEEIR